MNLISVRTSAILGILAPTVFLALYVTAMSIDDTYEFGENYLSDLGVGNSAWAFNSAVISAGCLMLLMCLFGLRPVLGALLISRAAVLLFLIASIFLVLVGVFNEDFGDLHGIVSYGFFLSMYICFGVLTVAFHRSKALGTIATIETGIAFAIGLVVSVGGGTPAVETIAVFVVLVWGYLVSIELLLKEKRARVPRPGST